MTPQPVEHDAAVVQAGNMGGDLGQHRVVAGQRPGQLARLHHRHGLREPGGGVPVRGIACHALDLMPLALTPAP